MSRISRPIKGKSLENSRPSLIKNMGIEVPYQDIEMLDPDTLEIAVRNRGGELIKTGKTLKDI